MTSSTAAPTAPMIVFCHLLNDNSGSPIVLRNVINALAPHHKGCQLFVGSQGVGCLDEVQIPVRRYWYRRSRFRFVTLLNFLASQIALYRALSKASIDADATVYVNTLLPFGAALWGFFNKRKVVYHAHEVSLSPAPLRWFLLKIASLTADQVLYVSNDQFCRLPVPGVKACILPNSVGERIASEGARTPYRAQKNGIFNVLMVSNPRDYKGVPEFVELARRFNDREQFRFTLVLNADDAELKRYLSPRSLSRNLSVFPRTDEPGQFYAEADVVLNLSRADLCVETFGLTIVEAMAFGVPVIVPPIGGPTEIVTNGEQGFLADSRDLDLLESLLAEMQADPAEMQRMSRAARRRASDFSQERYDQALRSIMKVSNPY